MDSVAEAKALLSSWKSHNLAYDTFVTRLHLSNNEALYSSEKDIQYCSTNREKFQSELLGQKSHVSLKKWAHCELRRQEMFCQHLIQPGKLVIVTEEEEKAAENESIESKHKLQAIKIRGREIQSLLRIEGEKLDSVLEMRKSQAEEVAQLLAEIAECERASTELRNKRSTADRKTLSELDNILTDQTHSLTEFGSGTFAASKKIKELKSGLVSKKRVAEELENVRNGLVKEANSRRKSGGGSGEEEIGCRWILSTTMLLKNLLGIKSAISKGTSQKEIILVYETEVEGNERSLSLQFNSAGQFAHAQLIECNISIEDIVEECLPSGDIQTLVAMVKSRISN